MNASDKTDITTHFNELSFLVWHIPKTTNVYMPLNREAEANIPEHNLLIIGGDMNPHVGKDGNNKFCLHNSPKQKW